MPLVGINRSVKGVTSSTGFQSGWRDLLISGLALRNGTSAPTFAVWRGGVYQNRYSRGDEAHGAWHIQHDYKPGSDVYMHVHVTPTNTNTGNIKFGFEWTYARGYSVDLFSNTTTTTYVEQAGAGSIGAHQIIESAPITIPNCEVDGVIGFRVFRDNAGGDTYTGDCFLIQVDLHYEVDRFATLNRNRGAGWDP